MATSYDDFLKQLGYQFRTDPGTGESVPVNSEDYSRVQGDQSQRLQEAFTRYSNPQAYGTQGYVPTHDSGLADQASNTLDRGSDPYHVNVGGTNWARTGESLSNLTPRQRAALEKWQAENPGKAAEQSDPTLGWLRNTDLNNILGTIAGQENTANDTPGWQYMAMLAAMAAGGYGLSEMGLAAGAEGAFGASGLAEGALASEAGFVPGSFELGASAGLDASGVGALGGIPDAAWGVNQQGGNVFDWDSFLSNPEGADWASLDATDPFGLGSTEGAGFDSGFNFDTAELDQWARGLDALNPDGSIDWTKVDSAIADPNSSIYMGSLDGAPVVPGEGGLSSVLNQILKSGGSSALKSLLGGGGTGALGGLGGLLKNLGIPALMIAGLLDNPDRTTTVNRTYDQTGANKAMGAADAYAALGTGAVAPLSANEQAAGALAASSAGQSAPYIQRGAAMTDQAALGIPGVDLNKYMNPYLQSVLDPILRRGQIEKAQTLNTLDAGAGMKNAFGGSRHALLSNLAGESADRNLNEAEANIRSGAFNTALGTAGTDLNRLLSAGSQTGAFGTALSNLTGQDITRLSTTGETARGVEQAKLNTPLTQIAAYQAALPKNPNFTQTTTGPEANKMAQLAGALAALSGMS